MALWFPSLILRRFDNVTLGIRLIWRALQTLVRGFSSLITDKNKPTNKRLNIRSTPQNLGLYNVLSYSAKWAHFTSKANSVTTSLVSGKRCHRYCWLFGAHQHTTQVYNNIVICKLQHLSMPTLSTRASVSLCNIVMISDHRLTSIPWRYSLSWVTHCACSLEGGMIAVMASMLERVRSDSPPLSTSSCRDDEVVSSCCSMLELDLLLTLVVRELSYKHTRGT